MLTVEMSWINWSLFWNSSFIFYDFAIFCIFFRKFAKKFETSQNDVIHREMQRKIFVGISVNKILSDFSWKTCKTHKSTTHYVTKWYVFKITYKNLKVQFSLICWLFKCHRSTEDFFETQASYILYILRLCEFLHFFHKFAKNLKLLKMMQFIQKRKEKFL